MLQSFMYIAEVFLQKRRVKKYMQVFYVLSIYPSMICLCDSGWRGVGAGAYPSC